MLADATKIAAPQLWVYDQIIAVLKSAVQNAKLKKARFSARRST
jgi:hypothetical protein